jgi:hypothetical protein
VTSKIRAETVLVCAGWMPPTARRKVHVKMNSKKTKVIVVKLPFQSNRQLSTSLSEKCVSFVIDDFHILIVDAFLSSNQLFEFFTFFEMM